VRATVGLLDRQAPDGPPDGHTRERGQGMVEISMVLPVFLLLLLAMLEFGLAFDHNISLTYATREGARVGAALVNGGGGAGCPNGATVDATIVQAVDRVLNSPGSLVDRSRIGEIRIYKSTSSGAQMGNTANRWLFAGGAFVKDMGMQNWDPCTRTNGFPPDSIGVSITYSYQLSTPLAAIMTFFGGGGPAQLGMADRTVMAMNPTD
jgi:hypothetical protein